MMKLRLLFVMLLGLLLAGCGYHLRGQMPMPFTSLYIQAPNDRAPLVLELKRELEANGVTLAAAPDKAQLVLEIVHELPEKKILSLGAAGRVMEYQLGYRVQLRARDAQHRDWLPPDELVLRRDFSYDDTKVLAKMQEEAMVYDYMRSDMVQQIVRRLSFAKQRGQE